MKIKRFTLIAFALLGTASCSSDGADIATAPVPSSVKGVNDLPFAGRERAPNIIVILTDDQGYADVGFNGSTEILTPNIDRIAYEGVRFDRGYVSFPVCGPSRAGLLTGRYQSRFGFDLNPSENPHDPNAGLPLTEQTIADVLKPAGYKSAIFGKWHMGNHPSLHPYERGFDEFFGFLNGGHNYFLDRLRPIKVEDAKNSAQLYNTWLMDGREQIETSGYLTDALSDKAVSFIEDNRDQPFFIYLSYNAPHVPMHATPEYLERYAHIEDEKRRTYAAMIAAVDDGVGDVLDTVDELGLAQDTIIFFLSDNGGPQKRAANASVNLPLRGGKGEMFEGGVRVPFAMRWTGTIPSGVDYPYPVSSLDILGTAAGVNGITPSAPNALDGVNLVPFLTASTYDVRPHEQLYWRYVGGKAGGIGRSAVMIEDDKRVTYPNAEYLFDLTQDKAEQNNLLRSEPALANDLEDAFKAWNKEMSKQSRISIFSEWP